LQLKKKNKLPVKQSANENGSIGVTVQPNGPGDVIIKVKVHGNQLKDSPCVVRVENTTAPKKCEIVCTAQMATKLVVYAMDHNGQPRTSSTDEVVASVVNKETGQPIVTNISNNNDGSYSVQFISESGDFNVDVKINGESAKDCPFVYNVVPFKSKFHLKDIFSLFGKK